MIPWQRWAQSASECPIRAIFILEGWSLMLLKEGLSWVCIFLLSPVLANWIQECLAAQAALCNNHPPGPTWTHLGSMSDTTRPEVPFSVASGIRSHPWLWAAWVSSCSKNVSDSEPLDQRCSIFAETYKRQWMCLSRTMLWTAHCIGPEFPLPTHLSINSSGLHNLFCAMHSFISLVIPFQEKKNVFTCKNKTLEIANQLYWNTPFKISLEYILRCAFLLRHSISRCHGRSNNYHDFKVEMGINDILRHVMTVMLKENACDFYWR